jgi:hypothetical protein
MRKRPSKGAQVAADAMGIAILGGAVLVWTAHGWLIWLGLALVLAGAAGGLVVYGPWGRSSN